MSSAPPRELATLAHLAIYGHVTTPDGAPAAGATVIATPASRHEQHVAVADEHGDYWLTFMPPGKSAITIVHDGQTIAGNDVWVHDRDVARCDAVLPAVVLAPLPARRIAVAEHEHLSIYGHVTTQDGRPAYGATVVAVSTAPFDQHTTMCNQDGDYWLSSVPSGVTALTVTYAGETIENEIRVDDRGPIRSDAVLLKPPPPALPKSGTLTIYGHLVDSHGGAASGAAVVAASSAMEGEEVAISDDHGDYRFDRLPRGWYTVNVYYNNATAELRVDGRTQLSSRHDAVLPDPPVIDPNERARE